MFTVDVKQQYNNNNLQFLGPLRWNISRSDQHASYMNHHKRSPLNNSNLSVTSSFQCLHSGHLPTTATFMLWVRGNITYLPKTELMSSFFLYILEYQKSDKLMKNSLYYEQNKSVICSTKSKTYHHYRKSIQVYRYFNALTEPLFGKYSD